MPSSRPMHLALLRTPDPRRLLGSGAAGSGILGKLVGALQLVAGCSPALLGRGDVGALVNAHSGAALDCRGTTAFRTAT